MNTRFKIRRLTYIVAMMMVTGVCSAGASVIHRNVAELTELAKDIVVARIVEVGDGISDQNVPYTEVTIAIDRTLKGDKSGTYSFRQFGLLEPRPMDDGLTYMNLTPPGWPRYQAGERVVLFLYHEASITGLRTTVGLLQGKFQVAGESLAGESTEPVLVNGVMNRGLFDGFSAPEMQLSDAERALLESSAGPVSEQAFLSFVQKAVDQSWFAHIDVGPTPGVDLKRSSSNLSLEP